MNATARVLRRLVTLAAGGRLGGSRPRSVAGSIFLVRIRNSHNSLGVYGRGTLFREGWAGSTAPQEWSNGPCEIDNGTVARRRALKKCPANPIPQAPRAWPDRLKGAAPSRELRPISFKTAGRAVRRSRTGRWEFGLDPEAALSLLPLARLPPSADSDRRSRNGPLALCCWSPL